MNKIFNRILNKAISVLSDEEIDALSDLIAERDEYANFGKPLTEEEKAMLTKLKTAVNVDDVKKLSNGKKDLSYLSWAQISKALTECLGKENWAMSDLTDDSITETPNNGGYLVHVTINLFRGKIVETMSLPIMDSANMPIKSETYSYTTRYNGEKTVEAIDAFNTYKNYQRAFVKAVAVATGLGIELYSGEDLPSPEEPESNSETQPKKPTKTSNKKDAKKSMPDTSTEEEPF